MSVNRRNHEMYPDPTAYEVLTKKDREEKKNKARPLVYICSPFSGEVERNTQNARRYSRFAALRGYIPITPHLLFPQFLDDNKPAERDLGLLFGNALMDLCAEVWVFGAHVSSGMAGEIERAKQLRYRIRYFTDRCEERKEALV